MRLVSAPLAAITVLFTFLFLREVLPAAPWAWTVGALAVAFQPMFGFISAGGTATTCSTRRRPESSSAWRPRFARGSLPAGACGSVHAPDRGPREINMVGLLPGIAAGLVFLVRGADRTARRDAAGGRSPPLRSPSVPSSSTSPSTRRSGTGGLSSAPAGIRSAAVRDPRGSPTSPMSPPAASAAPSTTPGSSTSPSPVHRFAVRLLPTARDLVQRLHRHLRLARVRFRTLGLRPRPRDRARDRRARGPRADRASGRGSAAGCPS